MRNEVRPPSWEGFPDTRACELINGLLEKKLLALQEEIEEMQGHGYNESQATYMVDKAMAGAYVGFCQIIGMAREDSLTFMSHTWDELCKGPRDEDQREGNPRKDAH